MECELSAGALVAWHFGELHGAERDALEAHVVGCGRCVREYVALKRELELVGSEDVAGELAAVPSPASAARLRAAVAAEFASGQAVYGGEEPTTGSEAERWAGASAEPRAGALAQSWAGSSAQMPAGPREAEHAGARRPTKARTFWLGASGAALAAAAALVIILVDREPPPASSRRPGAEKPVEVDAAEPSDLSLQYL